MSLQSRLKRLERKRGYSPIYNPITVYVTDFAYPWKDMTAEEKTHTQEDIIAQIGRQRAHKAEIITVHIPWGYEA